MNYDLKKLVAVFLGLRCHLSNSWYDNWTSPNAQGAAFANTLLLLLDKWTFRTLVGLLSSLYGMIRPFITC